MRVYRVLFHDPSAAPREPGGVLYIPPQGAGRIDNPTHYDTLYVGDTPAGVCAEVFYRGKYRLKWTTSMLALRRFPHLIRSLAWYDLDESKMATCDLDDPNELLAQSLRPSQVITRDYDQSQAWALRLYQQEKWAGVKWWSFNDARWASIGLWQTDVVQKYGVDPIAMDHPALAEAAAVLAVTIEYPKSRRSK